LFPDGFSSQLILVCSELLITIHRGDIYMFDRKMTKKEKRKAIVFTFSAILIAMLMLDYILSQNLQHTIVKYMRNFFRYSQFLAWCSGVLMGHWYHPYTPLDDTYKKREGWSVFILGLITGGVLGSGITLYYSLGLTWPQWITFVAGFLAGWFLCPVVLTKESMRQKS
jgi:peptidoglycan/LPS O-acetylase OafA/YrhL